MPPIKNAHTSRSAEQTLTEIQRLLVKKGVANLTVFFEGQQPAGLDFVLLVEATDPERRTTSTRPVHFRLPANVPGVARVLGRSNRADVRNQPPANVAWRNVQLWLEAQFALIEAGQAAVEQVFLPYSVASDGRTLFEHFAERPERLLGA